MSDPVPRSAPRRSHKTTARTLDTRTLKVAAISAVVAGAGLAVADANAAVPYTYFAGYDCCANRIFDRYNTWTTWNFAGLYTAQQVVCVQERVYPAGGGSFYDNYKCSKLSVGHALNGNNVDTPLCWINGNYAAGSCSSHSRYR